MQKAEAEFTFEKWVSASLGSDMVKKIRENQYINIGQTKRIFDFAFSNFYSNKFARIVELNLALDNDGAPIQDKNNELNQLKIKLMELQREKYQYEKSNTEKEQETNGFIKNIFEIENSKSTSIENSSILNQHLNIMLMEDKLSKKKQIKTKLDKANEKLTMFINDNNQTEPSECENLIHNFSANFKNRTGLTPRKIDSLNENFQSRCVQKMNKLSFRECLRYFESKISEETNKLNQILDDRSLQNEVNLFKYQKSNEFSVSNVQSLDAAINQELLNLIVLRSQIIKFQSEKNNFDSQYNTIRIMLKKYYRDYYNLYGRYFKSHVSLKKIESEYNELNSIFEQLKSEKDFYRNSFVTMNKNFDRTKKLEMNIQEKQLDLEDLFNENMEFYNQNFQFNLNRIRISCEQLVELLRVFNSNNPFLSTSRNDSTCLNNSKLMNQFKMYKLNLSQYMNQHQSQPVVQDDFKLSLLEESLGINEFNKAKCFLFSSLLGDYLNLVKEVKILNSANEQILSNQEAKKIMNDFNHLLNECQEFDQKLVNKYFGLFGAKSQQCVQTFNSMPKMEDLFYTWLNQPGVYECNLENYTVNSKNLEYYISYINDLMSRQNRNFM